MVRNVCSMDWDASVRARVRRVCCVCWHVGPEERLQIAAQECSKLFLISATDLLFMYLAIERDLTLGSIFTLFASVSILHQKQNMTMGMNDIKGNASESSCLWRFEGRSLLASHQVIKPIQVVSRVSMDMVKKA